jgi:hypothetical protein
MAAGDLPILIAGDVHGDLERLVEALMPYPASEWRTIFLGDLVDYGVFGVGALRYARDRPNTTVLLGNHEVAMLWALRDPTRVGWWIGVGGQRHDLDELSSDVGLQSWLLARPAMLRLPDNTLVQHCGSDSYANLITRDGSDIVDSVNERVRDLLTVGEEETLWREMSGRNIFATQPVRLEKWLELTGARRVVFGHNPHRGSKPASYHGGSAINFDGAFSRGHPQFRRRPPAGASIGPLAD